MLVKVIYSVEGWYANFKDHVFYFDAQHEAQAFFDKVCLKHSRFEWYLETSTVFAHSSDALDALEGKG
jgi:hypothetical protein